MQHVSKQDIRKRVYKSWFIVERGVFSSVRAKWL
jgi:hypothetical protein